MYRPLLVLICLGLGAALAAPASAMARRAPEAVVAKAFEGPLILKRGEPSTITLPSVEGEPVLELVVSELSSGADEAPLVRVFLGEDTEDALEEPGYIGAASFFPLPISGPVTFSFNIAPAAKKLGVTPQEAGSVPVTLVLDSTREPYSDDPPLTATVTAIRLRPR